MSNYTKSTNFATKDNLISGDPLKIVKGTEIDTEFNNIATAIATKTDNASAAITGGTITGITDLAVADGGTGASTAAGALNNLLPSQTSAANKYLQSDGTNASWDAVSLSTSDITGTLAVANGGTGVTTSTGTTNVVLSNSPTLVTPALGTPSSATLTNATGLPISTGVSGLGTGVATALSVNTGQNNAVVLFNGALGTPSSGTVSNLTGTASININGTVGVVNPASGSFTTLTSSSTVTINGGTANGIGYLNASKVFTTGTVLKFDGTNITSDRSSGTAYSGTSFATWTNGIVLNNSATPATGLLNSLYFTNNANMQNVFGVAQNASGYGDFVWAGYAGTYTEWMKLTSAGLSITGTLSASSTATLNTLSSSGATLTGGTINGMTVGATTASTGAFTTLTTSSTVTHNGGTANGVTYLNGSKVLTSGSALTFDGTSLGVKAATTEATNVNIGGGRSGNGYAYLDLIGDAAQAASYSARLIRGNGGANTTTSLIHKGTGALEFTASDAGYLTYNINGSEQMRLTSTGLGIGTTNPIAKLHVSNAGAEGLEVSPTTGIVRLTAYNRSGGAYTSLALIGTGGLALTLGSTGIDFNSQMLLNTSGNLGLGVTPSAWGSGFKVLQLPAGTYGGGALVTDNGSPNIAANCYNNSGWKYVTTGDYATLYQSRSGQHQWYTAASGTAGNAISFTQAMTLQAGGNLLVSQTSWDFANNGTQIAASGRIFNTSSTDYNMELAGAQGGRVRFYTSAGGSATTVGSITVSTSATAYNTTSDQRLKENIQDADSASSLIDSLQVRKFDWKADNAHQRYGFVAQELVTVAPEAVHQPTDTDEMMAVDYSKLVPMLVKEIQSLRQRLSAANL
jgi:hypothetical protein